MDQDFLDLRARVDAIEAALAAVSARLQPVAAAESSVPDEGTKSKPAPKRAKAAPSAEDEVVL